MISREEEQQKCRESRPLLKRASMEFSPEELDGMVAADFGLGRLDTEGAQILTFVDTACIGAKALVLLPGQTMVEHRHPARDRDSGKEETLRCLWGRCLVYLPGDDTMKEGCVPEGQERWYACRHERVLHPTDQITIPPDTPHWFQAGPEGCAVLSVSNSVTDHEDRFTDPNVIRQTKYEDD